MREYLAILLCAAGMFIIVAMHRPDPRVVNVAGSAGLHRTCDARVFRSLLRGSGHRDGSTEVGVTAR